MTLGAAGAAFGALDRLPRSEKAEGRGAGGCVELADGKVRPPKASVKLLKASFDAG